MKKMFSFAIMILGILMMSTFCVSADYQYGNLYYEISSNKITITDCDESVTSVSVPAMIDGKYVTAIGEEAFADCLALKSISIPESVETIGKNAFYNTRYYNVQSNWVDDVLYIDHAVIKVRNTKSGNCEIRPGTRVIADNAFYGCNRLTVVSLPGGITELPEYAFHNCTSLINVEIPGGITRIGYSAFGYCLNLAEMTIPESLTYIAYSAFYGCDKLSDVYITSIESWCNISFGNMHSNPMCYADNLYIDGVPVLDISVEIPEGAKKINDYTFLNWEFLADIKIPESVTYIGLEAFRNCSRLDNIIIPDVTVIGAGAFYNCRSLKTVLYTGSESEWNKISVGSNNEYLINATIIYDVRETTYSFVTGTDEVFSEVTGYYLPSAPVPYDEGRTFVGWYDNPECKGSAVTFPYYGKATIFYASWIDGTGMNFNEAFEALANTEYYVTPLEPEQRIYYKFVPRYTGEYRFVSESGYDTFILLHDSKKYLIALDDRVNGTDFDISYNLTAGEVYYIAVGMYAEKVTFKFEIKAEFDEEVEIKDIIMTGSSKQYAVTPYYLPIGCEVIFASYNGGKLVEVESFVNNDKTMYFSPKKSFDSAKIMVWDSFGNMKPVCNIENIK